MTGWDTVAILGVGLMGGSIGLGLRTRGLARRTIGIGRSAERLQKAEKIGAITSGTTDLAAGVAEADLVVVCTPVAQIVADARLAAAHCKPGALLTDVGSTKERIVAELDGELAPDVRFVGSHPMAGSEKTGVDAARADLYEGRTVALTPTANTRQSDIERLSRFWTSLGARVVTFDAREHDQIVAASSHLPHVAASALAAVAPTEAKQLVAGGFLDTTRIASGDPELWEQILLDNSEHVLAALERFAGVLETFRSAIEGRDAAKLRALLMEAKANRDALGS